MEAAGISTIAVSMVPDLTAAAGAPRVAAIDFPFGRPFGQPHDAATQTAILRTVLQVLQAADRPGTVVHLPFEWPEPADHVHWHPREPSPIIRLAGRDPTVRKRLVAGDVLPEASRRTP